MRPVAIKKIVRRAFLLLVCMSGWGVAAAIAGERVHIAKGETWLIGQLQASLTLERLEIDDGARIRFAPGVQRWQLTADEIYIGNGVFIDAFGRSGASGKSAAAVTESAPCQNGADGGDGEPGERGGDALPVTLAGRLMRLGSLTVDVRGGSGGVGGAASAGANAGDHADCNARDGGDGGTGGRGGDGGNGGRVVLDFVAGGIAADDMKMRLHVLAEGGAGATGGSSGDAGQASPGRYVMQKTLTGRQVWVSGGKDGRPGSAGGDGSKGRPGSVVFPVWWSQETRVDSEGSDAVGGSGTDRHDERVQALEARMAQLQKRMLELERRQVRQEKALQSLQNADVK